MEHEDWDEALLIDAWAQGESDADDALRARVLERSSGVVRGRAQTRRALAVAVVVTMFAGGFLVRHSLDRGAEGSPTASDPIRADAVDLAIPLDDAEGLEVRAEITTGPDQARWYRLAGDAWLNVHGDTVAATRCYRHHLEMAGASVEPAPEDSWLLLALRRTMDD